MAMHFGMKSTYRPLVDLARPLIHTISCRMHRIRLATRRPPSGVSFIDGDPFEQVDVDPRAISRKFLASPEDIADQVFPCPLRGRVFHRYLASGYIFDFGWFARTVEYDSSEELLFDALFQRFHFGRSWEDITYYSRCVDSVARGIPCWNGCRSAADVRYTAMGADKLILSVRKYGFRRSSDPVLINIGPDGCLVKNGNGRHRIILARLAEEMLPAQVVVRHPAALSSIQRHPI